MAHNFKGLREAMSPEAQFRAQEKALAMTSMLPLAELRWARSTTREQLAAQLAGGRHTAAKIEKKADMYISTLRRFIEAMGGQLEIRAHFPDGDVRISQFEDLEDVDDLDSRAQQSA